MAEMHVAATASPNWMGDGGRSSGTFRIAFRAPRSPGDLGKTMRNGADDDHGGAGTGAIDEEVRQRNRGRCDQPQDPGGQLLLPSGAIRLWQDIDAPHDCRP